MKIKKRWILFGFLLIWIIWAQSCLRDRISDSKAKIEFKNAGIPVYFGHLHLGDTSLHYIKVGRDTLPTLFFIHGSPGSWEAYKEYLLDKKLLKFFRIIAIDRPGYGYSSFGTPFHLKEQSELIYKIVEHEQNGKAFHLIGHSLGGPVVVKMAQDHPQSYASLTILAGSISPYDEPKEGWRKILIYTPLQYFLPTIMRISNIEIYYFKEALYGMLPNYDKLTMPVTFIHGDKDPLVTIKNTDFGKKMLTNNKNLKIIIIPGANHFIPWEHFDIIEKHLLTLSETR